MVEKYKMGEFKEILDYTLVRLFIPHILGENTPNENGLLLCNGNCSWITCRAWWRCFNCDYIECYTCQKIWESKIENIYPWIKRLVGNFCRNCLVKNTIHQCEKNGDVIR
jgi:hypothetical protein